VSIFGAFDGGGGYDCGCGGGCGVRDM